MTSARLFAIGFIYVCTAVAWFVLGGTIVSRTGESDVRLAEEVAQLWGGRHEQRAPELTVFRPREVVDKVQEKDAKGALVEREVKRTVVDEHPLPLDESRVDVSLDLDQRRKGLLWYDTYGVAFSARYRLHNPDPEPRGVRVLVTFPSTQAIYDGFVFRVNGKEAPPVTDLSKGVPFLLDLQPGEEAVVELAYRSRGLGEWAYAFAPQGVAQVRNFRLDMTTDFAGIDFPAGTLSPSSRERAGAGWKLSWAFDSMVTGQKVGMDAPNRLNPGPFASRVTFFAPVSLLFFVTVLVILGALRGKSLHPVNYFFLAAAFFAFHLLLAYLVDHVDVHVAFGIAALTSVALVVSYLRLVAGMRYALLEAGLAQVVFLVLFSYAFFFEGYTGLTVTVGAVLTLFVLMQLTGRVDWAEVFARREKAEPVRDGRVLGGA
jgi:hypothetical protein